MMIVVINESSAFYFEKPVLIQTAILIKHCHVKYNSIRNHIKNLMYVNKSLKLWSTPLDGYQLFRLNQSIKPTGNYGYRHPGNHF